MANDKIRVRAEASAWVPMVGLEVTGDLCGQSHAFKHNDRMVVITLPKVKFGDDFQPLEQYRDVVSYRSACVHDKRLESTTYQVGSIEVSIPITEQITVPAQMLILPLKQPEIAGPKLTERLNELAVDYEARLASGVKHWEEVVRWISGSSALGTPDWQPGREAATRLSMMRIAQASDKHRFWAPTQGYASLAGGPLNDASWKAIGKALEAGHEAPIWFRYTDEAHHRYRSRDLVGAVLSSAIACETIARECFWLVGGATESDTARDLIDQVSIRGILNRWEKLTGIGKGEISARDLNALFDLRNRLMHAGGKGANFNLASVSKLLTASRAFVFSGSRPSTWCNFGCGHRAPSSGGLGCNL